MNKSSRLERQMPCPECADCTGHYPEMFRHLKRDHEKSDEDAVALIELDIRKTS